MRPSDCCRLVASCDRGDIGGLSTAVGPEPDGLPSVFVYDGYPGGAGFAERASAGQAPGWVPPLPPSRRVNARAGCPSCVQSPKCGNGNDPLDKAGLCACCGWCSRRWHHEGETSRMATDPSTVDFHVSVVAAAMKAHFLAAEETRTMPKLLETVRRTVGQRNPFAIRVGAAAKYPAALTCASRRMT